jgi:hypothetical protein
LPLTWQASGALPALRLGGIPLASFDDGPMPTTEPAFGEDVPFGPPRKVHLPRLITAGIVAAGNLTLTFFTPESWTRIVPVTGFFTWSVVAVSQVQAFTPKSDDDSPGSLFALGAALGFGALGLLSSENRTGAAVTCIGFNLSAGAFFASLP